jgi:hypothetical protein
MPATFVIGETFTFNTKSPTLLGISVKNAKLISKSSIKTARKIDPGLEARYRTIFPTLPSGTSDNIAGCEFYEFETQDGKTIVLADQWIDFTSVVVVENITLTVTILHTTPPDKERIRSLLVNAGYAFISIK